MTKATGAHATHDELLLAAFVAGDVSPGERARAELLVASCTACADLVGDLRAIARATAQLPAPARRRDFRLTPADAARLRPSGWRGLLSAAAGPKGSLARPLGTALATLGVAGLLLGTVPGIVPGQGGQAPAAASRLHGGPTAESAAGAPSAQPSVGAGALPVVPSPGVLFSAPSPGAAGVAAPVFGAVGAPSPTAGVASNGERLTLGPVASSSGGPPVDAGTSAAPTAEPSSAGGPAPLVAASAALLVIGLALVGVSFVRRGARSRT